MDYPWIVEAKRHIGIEENKDAPRITKWVQDLKLSWFTSTFRASTVAWCGVFTARCMQVSNLAYPKMWMRAMDWSNWGVKLNRPIDGCVVVFNRKGGGHVGFVMGETMDGYLSVLGGNQNNRVTVAKFDKVRVVGYYWPSDYPLPANRYLSMMSTSGPVSTNEA